MKNHYTPFEKLGKRQKKAENNLRRTTWQISPVTRIKESGKTYNRSRAKAACRKEQQP